MKREVEIILGAPGCGKTTALMAVLEKEMSKVAPEQIAFVSFTRKGTYEGTNRAKELFGYNDTRLPWFRTLDSIAFRTGNYSRNDLIKSDDYKNFGLIVGRKFTGYYTADFKGNDDKYLFYYSMLKENPTKAEELEADLNMPVMAYINNNFDAFKQREGVVDFPDMVQSFIQRNEALPVEVAIIDEAQDLSVLKWNMCRVAFRNCKRIYIAGDDDQAIYEWSGADLKHFLSLPRRGDNKVTILDKSYRMRKTILDFAKKISSEIEDRVDKEFAPVSEGGNINYHNKVETVEIKPGETYYLLARNNYHLRQFVELMIQQGILFEYKHSKSFDEKEFRVITLYERMRKGFKLDEKDEMAVRVYTKENANMKDVWYKSLKFKRIPGVFADSDEKMDYYRTLIQNKVKLVEPLVSINTIHGVKGGEADNVVLMLDYTNKVKQAYDSNPDSELRILYVGMTRAKNSLELVFKTSKHGYDDVVNYIRNYA